MNSTTSEYMTYCSNEDNAGHTSIRPTIDTMFDDLDSQEVSSSPYDKMYVRFKASTKKYNRGDYQYGKG